MNAQSPASLAALIDHTQLKATATESDILTLCQEAREYSFYSVCLHSRWLPLAVRELQSSSVLPITVVGFPLGAQLSKAKARETEVAIEAGAREIDMVLDLGAAKMGRWKECTQDIRSVVEAAQGRPVKVILETCYLTDDEIRHACTSTQEGGAQFVKTSTGFGTGGATVEHIRLMRSCVGPQFGVKASGGIRDLATALAMKEAGANRLGCSASVAIVRGLEGSSHGY